jgi:alginate O-acetyltransferase complex protein AlgI
MVFSSIIFLFLFLPLVLGLYHVAVLALSRLNPRAAVRAGNVILLLASLFFYAWGEQELVLVMMASIAVNYTCGRVMARGRFRDGRLAGALVENGPRDRRQKIALIAGVAANLAVLAVFKYFNFAWDNLHWVAGRLGLPDGWMSGLRFTLPRGISFYTFQSMSYTIDVYRGKARATNSLLDFACYVSLFPQLVAGPIVRYSDLSDQLLQRRVTRERFASGVGRFIEGLAKKVLIANVVAESVDKIFGLPSGQLGPATAWLGVVLYALQIYFDFSGYSDMAIGLGRMFGFEFIENFNYPYISRSIREFWRRWHISLSTWFRDYLYISLGGNRKSEGRTYFNLLIVFLLCGLWHGASWTFVAWGLLHGTFLVIERLGFGAWLERRPRTLQHAYAIFAVLMAWVMFRAETISQAGAYYLTLLGQTSAASAANVADYVTLPTGLALLAGILFSLPVKPVFSDWYDRLQERLHSASGAVAILVSMTAEGGYLTVMLGLFVMCASQLASGSFNPFIYFRF